MKAYCGSERLYDFWIGMLDICRGWISPRTGPRLRRSPACSSEQGAQRSARRGGPAHPRPQWARSAARDATNRRRRRRRCRRKSELGPIMSGRRGRGREIRADEDAGLGRAAPDTPTGPVRSWSAPGEGWGLWSNRWRYWQRRMDSAGGPTAASACGTAASVRL